ncbi:SusC/RagA family TonB-linked outer membrane protein [Parapedobacter koreensis]|uniref:TonB-linked outer membrane protein, SusC/RagA family n=1 Tax=Parapedobacter koreensis TaxID=332977 RepID=A0A1H7MDI5_9SPHI|nr:SusC/RagA family TonB-linked outer membrane protein [Parapedobacter koreensis]SEL09263.1 TonB-linked outer membrane protein, SusC/RagA family [Parapedobacter koreensis]
MKQKLRLGDSYALIRYISLLAITITMCAEARSQRPEPSGPVLSGIVVDTAGLPIAGATITTKGTSDKTISAANGRFTFYSKVPSGTLMVSYLGHRTADEKFGEGNIGPFHIVLIPNENMLDEVEVSTGYQKLSPERSTGSFVHVDNELLNRSFSSDLLSRLEGVTNGLLFNRSTSGTPVALSVRGPSTIHADGQPLIILDNFEYNGDLRNINPNDIASVTVLKDAGASSIWGAKAGNGVIVITSKNGRYNAAPRVTVGTNVSTTAKPDLFSQMQVSSGDFIDLELFLFNRGYYNNTLTNNSKPAVSPLVWLLAQRRAGLLSSQDSAGMIDALRGLDVRNDISNYLDRTAVAQQYTAAISGGSQHHSYHASAGWDKNLTNKVGNGYDRLTLNFNNTFLLLRDKLEITTGVIYTQAKDEENDPFVPISYPYAQLADAGGRSLPIARYNQGFLDTVGQGRLLDWTYRPLDELRLMDNTVKTTDLKFNVATQYRLTSFLKASLRYQYGRGISNRRDHRSQASFFTRDLINQFSSIASNGQVARSVPLGGILDLRSNEYTAHHLRGQLDVDKAWGIHSVSGIIGGELSDVVTQSAANRFYGYNEERETVGIVDPVNSYTSMVTGRSNIRIPAPQNLAYLTDRFVSYYANASYSYDNRYILSASFRRDASNLFGVATNQKWTPLWSAGLAWKISDERFYGVDWLPSVKLRATYGKSGNIDRNVTAFLTAMAFPVNEYGQPTMTITNPPNPDLKWETITMVNTALDFALLKSHRVTGSVEYYWKIGKDLMGDAEIPSSSGRSTYRGNTAAMAGHGLDLTLNTQNLMGKLRWRTDAMYSYTWNKVTEYLVKPVNLNSYMGGAFLEGKPIRSLFAYRWAGLDPSNGNPRGYIGEDVSADYSALVNSTDLGELLFVGSVVPTHFGSLRNTFDWKSFSFSFNIVYKFGYFFRRNSLDYASLFSGSYQGNPDFVTRWQQPGDEATTDVPSLVYPANTMRDNFYRNSEILAISGSHIRLQDVRLAYHIANRQNGKLPFEGIQVFAMASNLGLLWRSNTYGIDPDSQNISQSHTISGGIRLEF